MSANFKKCSLKCFLGLKSDNFSRESAFGSAKISVLGQSGYCSLFQNKKGLNGGVQAFFLMNNCRLNIKT